MAKKGANLLFTNKDALPYKYRRRFVMYVEELAPEVMESLTELIPKYLTVIRRSSRNKVLRTWIEGNDLSPFTDDDPAQTKLDRGIERAILEHVEPPSPSIADEKAFKSFSNLQEAFDKFITNFSLTRDWLREEFLMRLRIIAKNRKGSAPFAFVSVSDWRLASGQTIQFGIKGWRVDEDWSTFESRARRKLEALLSKHKEATAEHFRDLGYKRATKPHDLSSVRWLVLWTVKKTKKSEILKLIALERPSTMTEEELNSSFRELADKYDLPYRHSKRGKSTAQNTSK